MVSKAFDVGFADGLAWDLDGYASVGAIAPYGWDEATINAMGADNCRRAWGVQLGASGDETWGVACEEYNRGAYRGATAPQTERTGLPPRSSS